MDCTARPCRCRAFLILSRGFAAVWGRGALIVWPSPIRSVNWRLAD